MIVKQSAGVLLVADVGHEIDDLEQCAWLVLLWDNNRPAQDLGGGGNTHISVENQGARLTGPPRIPSPRSICDGIPVVHFEVPNIGVLVRQAYIDKCLPELIKKRGGPRKHVVDV